MTAESITATRRSFTASDGVRLSYVMWSRGHLDRCHTLVLILHGIGFHAEPYEVVAQGVKLPGTVFAGLDFRGHGRSGGGKGQMPQLDRMLKDIQEWVDHMKTSFPEAQVFMMAESMAGPFATLYAAENPTCLGGLALIAPAVLLSWQQVWHRETLSAIGEIVRRPGNPTFHSSAARLPQALREANFVYRRLTDPLALQDLSRDYLISVGFAMARSVLRPKLDVDFPVLLVHGDRDNIVSPLGTRVLYWRFRSPEKQLAILPGVYHTLMWDSSSPRLFSLVERWVAQHSGLEAFHWPGGK